MKVAPRDIEAIYDRLRTSVGVSVCIVESISRSRDRGHDRHFATRSQLRFELREVEWAFSGSQLLLSGPPGFSYGISCDSLVSIESHAPDAVTFVEHFEIRLERRTEIEFRSPELKLHNKAPEPTSRAVTTRAPSSTARASSARGSS
jgi:hypothetical protein